MALPRLKFLVRLSLDSVVVLRVQLFVKVPDRSIGKFSPLHKCGTALPHKPNQNGGRKSGRPLPKDSLVCSGSISQCRVWSRGQVITSPKRIQEFTRTSQVSTGRRYCVRTKSRNYASSAFPVRPSTAREAERRLHGFQAIRDFLLYQVTSKEGHDGEPRGGSDSDEENRSPWLWHRTCCE